MNLLREVMEVESLSSKTIWGNGSRSSVKDAEHAHEDYYRGIARLTIGLVAYDRAWLYSFAHSSRDPTLVPLMGDQAVLN
jgi:hypothetical protein